MFLLDQHGLDVLSSDEEFINNDFKPNKFTTKTSSTPKTNGYATTTGPVAASCSVASNRARRSLRFTSGSTAAEGDDVEEVTIVRRIKRIFNSSSSSSSSQVQRLIADLTPEPVQRISRQVTEVIPIPVILAFLMFTILTSLWYFSLFPTVDGCERAWNNFANNISYVCSSMKELSMSLFGMGMSTCSGLVLLLKSSTVMIWSAVTSFFPSSPGSKFIYSSMDDPPDARTLARIEEALRVYGQTLESLDSRLTDLKYEVTSNKENIELLKKSCCKDPKELEALINSSVKSFWIKMFPSLSPSSSDEQLKKQVQEHLSKIAKDSHDEQMGEFNDRFQRKLDEVTQSVLVQIQELKSHQEKVQSGGKKVEKDLIDETITRSTIQRMITDAISMYDADKTGIPDFALEPSGKLYFCTLIHCSNLRIVLPSIRWIGHQY